MVAMVPGSCQWSTNLFFSTRTRRPSASSPSPPQPTPFPPPSTSPRSSSTSLDRYYENLLEGKSGIDPIDHFDAAKFSTRFVGQIQEFRSEGYIDGKNDQRLDDCLHYCIVGGKKALESAGIRIGTAKLEKILI